MREVLGFYMDEMKDSFLYSILAEVEKDEEVREKLLELSSMEREHADFWKDFLESRGVEVYKFRPNFTMNMYKLLRKLFGLSFTSKVMEMGEGFSLRGS